MKNNKQLLPILISVAAIFGLLIGMFLDFPMKRMALSENEIREQKVKQIIDYVDFEYVDKVNTDSLLDLTITDLLRRLDPHSSYIPLEEVTANEEGIKGSFEGIGIEFKIFRDTLTVVKVIEGGPSSKAGLKAGNRILLANDERLYGENVDNNFLISRLKGKSGTKVVLDVWDKEKGEISKKTVTRGRVPLQSVVGSFMLNDSTGYIKLIRFAETSKNEIREALLRLKKSGAKSLVLDLRDNPGGLLGAARDVADQFLTKNKLIVFTKDREGKKSEIFATSRGLFIKEDVAVLINEGSASASEIVAGALQDNDRAVIVGRRSFGKGLVQEEITLDDGSKIRLTTQRYYTPTGRSIQKPFEDYDQSFLIEKGHGVAAELQDSSGIDRFVTPKGKVVYGGGGITPDIHVPFDTSREASLLYHLALRANMDDKAFRYVDDHRSMFSNQTKDEFMTSFEIDREVVDFFYNGFADKLDSIDENVYDALKLRIKAFIASNIYGNSAYLEVYYKKDPIITIAEQQLSVIK